MKAEPDATSRSRAAALFVITAAALIMAACTTHDAATLISDARRFPCD